MFRLSIFSIFVPLEQYRQPYLGYLTNEYRYLQCWLSWLMIRFGFQFEAVDWVRNLHSLIISRINNTSFNCHIQDCGFRQVTSTLPATTFLVPGCTFVYTFYNKIFLLSLRRGEEAISIAFRVIINLFLSYITLHSNAQWHAQLFQTGCILSA